MIKMTEITKIISRFIHDSIVTNVRTWLMIPWFAWMAFDQRTPLFVILIPWQSANSKQALFLWRVLYCVQAFWGDQGEERWTSAGSQNMLIDGYASVLACSCKQKDQCQNIKNLQMLLQIGHNLTLLPDAEHLHALAQSLPEVFAI